MTNKLTDKVLKKIKSERIKPTARWHFLLKNYLIWTAAGVTFIVGILAVPVIIHMLVTNDWDVYAYAGFSLPQFILVTLPYFWLVFLMLCLALVYYNLKHTKDGYRYNAIYIVIVSVAISLLTGGALYGAGLGRAIDEQFAQNIPLYERFAQPRHFIWMQNHHGLLAGTVTAVTDDTHFRLVDFHNRPWEIIYSMPSNGALPLQPQMRVRAIGRRVDSDTFNAHMLAPFDRVHSEWMRSRMIR